VLLLQYSNWLTVVSYVVGLVYKQSTGGQSDVNNGRLSQSADVPGPRTSVQLTRVRPAVLVRAWNTHEPEQEVRGLVGDQTTHRLQSARDACMAASGDRCRRRELLFILTLRVVN